MYKVVYYEDLRKTASGVQKNGLVWLDEINDIGKKLMEIVESEALSGKAADNIKNYINQIHNVLISIMSQVIKTFIEQSVDYQNGYKEKVDSGKGDTRGISKTTLVFDELQKKGIVQKNINSALTMTSNVVYDAKKVKNSISDIVTIYASPRSNNLVVQLNKILKIAENLDNNITNYELSRANDFTEIDELIAQANKIISTQLGNNRTSVALYTSGEIGTICDVGVIKYNLESAQNITDTLEASEDFREAWEFVLNSDNIIAEEEREDREWVQWVALGVTAVATVTVLVVTAGTASPLVAAGVGAATSFVSSSVSKLADNYVENGSFIDGMDWKDFGKDVFIDTVVGGVGGGLGVISKGTAIQQPISKAMSCCAKSIIKSGAKDLASTAWDFGEAVIMKKPGDEIVSILEKDTSNMLKNITVEGVKGFAEGFISQSFGIDTSDKSNFRKLSEKVIEKTISETIGGTINTVWELGEGYYNSPNEINIKSILIDNAEKTLGGIAGKTVEELVGMGKDAIDTSDSNKIVKGIAGATEKVIEKTLSTFGEKSAENGAATLFGDDEKYNGDLKDFYKNVWENDLEGGKKLFEYASEGAKDGILEDKIRDLDYDHDGKINVAYVGDYQVSSEEYHAALENAGKGAYEGKTAQEILGLPRDTDLSDVKERSVPVDKVIKYKESRSTIDTVTVDDKYTFRKSFYDGVINSTSSSDEARDILGIGKDVDLSEDNIQEKRVASKEIGIGKEYTFIKDSGTAAKKIHVTNLSKEERLRREKEKNDELK